MIYWIVFSVILILLTWFIYYAIESDIDFRMGVDTRKNSPMSKHNQEKWDRRDFS